MKKTKITLYIATTIDGYIAEEKGTVKFLDGYGNKKQDYGYSKFLKSIDVIIMGNTTYKQYGAKHYGKKKVYVYSKKKKGKKENIEYTNLKPQTLIKKLQGKKVWLLGGAKIIEPFQKEKTINEYIITIIPKILGKGIPLFKKTNTQQTLKLKKIEEYHDGVIQITYTKK